MVRVPIFSGITTDSSADFRTEYPVNLVPVPMGQGISNGYLRPADGIKTLSTGTGLNRGGINWNGVLYRVLGNDLVFITDTGDVVTVGTIGGTNRVTMHQTHPCLLYTSPSPRDGLLSRMPSSA